MSEGVFHALTRDQGPLLLDCLRTLCVGPLVSRASILCSGAKKQGGRERGVFSGAEGKRKLLELLWIADCPKKFLEEGDVNEREVFAQC